MARGGYRKPSNPAPVSGPGRLSRRTDGGPTQGAKKMKSNSYGEGKQLMEMQQAAPMAAAQQPRLNPAAAPARPARPAAKPTELFAATQLPSEPVTAGMPFGPGGGPEEVVLPGPKTLSSALKKILPNDVTGEVTELYNYLVSRGM